MAFRSVDCIQRRHEAAGHHEPARAIALSGRLIFVCRARDHALTPVVDVSAAADRRILLADSPLGS